MSMSEITKAEAELYRGVDRANPPQHEKLITGWLPPEAPPEGYKRPGRDTRPGRDRRRAGLHVDSRLPGHGYSHIRVGRS